MRLVARCCVVALLCVVAAPLVSTVVAQGSPTTSVAPAAPTGARLGAIRASLLRQATAVQERWADSIPDLYATAAENGFASAGAEQDVVVTLRGDGVVFAVCDEACSGVTFRIVSPEGRELGRSTPMDGVATFAFGGGQQWGSGVIARVRVLGCLEPLCGFRVTVMLK